ncbi:MAG: endonuclease/exonuclease/phosphatase family protein [Actinobacteria bacterium]|nr:endonuclease/exonuclease/phosphatase family protein [Actinomycetota bacterium]
MADVLWWLSIGVLLGLTLTQVLGFDRSKPIAVLQSLSLHALACALPLGVLAALDGRWAIAALSVLPLAALVWLALPIVKARRTIVAEPAFSLAFGNVLAKSRRPADAVAAMVATDADVLVMVEFTPAMHDELTRLAGGEYPYRVAEVHSDPAGIAVWSRIPMTGEVVHIIGRPTVDLTLQLASGPVRVLAIHTIPPTLRAPEWSDELRVIGDAAGHPSEGDPTVIVGDFNAARWHPSFRRLLARGWTSGHELLGSGWSVSWPMRGYPAPPFVRIDHALVDTRVVPVDVREVSIAGSDHRGFVMSFGVTAFGVTPGTAPH